MDTPQCEVHGQFHVCDECVKEYQAEERAKYDATLRESGPDTLAYVHEFLKAATTKFEEWRTPFILIAGPDIPLVRSAGFTKEHVEVLKAYLETHFSV